MAWPLLPKPSDAHDAPAKRAAAENRANGRSMNHNLIPFVLRWSGARRARPVVGLMLVCWMAIAAAAPPGAVPDRLLVKPRAGGHEATVQALFNLVGAREADRIAQIDVRILQVPPAIRDRVLEALQHNPNIEFAEPDYIVEPDLIPNDTYYPSEWHPAKIQAPQAWDITTGSASVMVAILDSGIDSSHPDLAGRLVPGWNFYDNNSNLADVTSHGTAVAGTAVSDGNNGLGVAAIAWGCYIMPLRITDASGNGSASAITSALTWAADHGARVANISYGNVTKIASIDSAAQYFQSKGGVVTASAGNSGIFDSSGDNPHFLLVSATLSDDRVASWSNTGNNIDLAAPGGSIVTTLRGGGYGAGTGTSFSAPVVAGVAALVLSVNSGLSGTQLRSLLEQTADDLGPAGWDTGYGWGRVNAYKAVLAAAGQPPDTTPPSATICAPANGSTVSGTASVAVSGSDNVGVTRLECYLDGALAASSATASATFSWDTTTATNGSHNLQAKAYDAAGNSGASSLVTVTVQNADATAPVAAITAPSNGSTVSNAVTVNINATDNTGVASVEWYLDGVLAGSSAGASASFPWDTTKSANGPHSLQAKAYDTAGNAGASATSAVTVQNAVADTTAPTVQITSPASGAKVGKTVKIYVSASDNVGVTRVDLNIDGKLFGSSTSSAPVFSWNTSKAAGGQHTLQAFAYDAAGNQGASAIVTVNK